MAFPQYRRISGKTTDSQFIDQDLDISEYDAQSLAVSDAREGELTYDVFNDRNDISLTLDEYPRTMVKHPEIILASPDLPDADSGSLGEIKEPLGNPWRPGWTRRFPWTGIGSLLLIVGLTGTAAAVLAVSDKSPVNNWHVGGTRIQPQVWLAILSTVMDGLTTFALSSGAVISFWVEGLRGTTLRNLYHSYESTSFLGALRNVFRGRFNTVAIACILAVVSLVRGPLLQKASSVQTNALIDSTGAFTIRLAQQVPPGFFWANRMPFSDQFQTVYDQFSGNTPIVFNYTGCGDTCNTALMGYGFAFNCSYSEATIGGGSQNFTAQGFKNGFPAFNISAAISGYDSAAGDPNGEIAGEEVAEAGGIIHITNLYKSASNCQEPLSLTRCEMRPAIQEYQVVLQNDTIALANPNWQQDALVSYVSPWNNFTAFNTSGSSWGVTDTWLKFFITEFANELDISLDPLSDTNFTASAWDTPSSQLARQFVNGDSISTLANMSCSTTFRDPTQVILNRIRNIAFRTAVAAANTTNTTNLFSSASLAAESASQITNWTQTVPYTAVTRGAIFHSSWIYAICFVLVSLSGVLGIAPLFYGFWELGRDVSLNPLEIARAFESPLLRDVDANEEKNAIVRQVGRGTVQYGIKVGESPPRLRMAQAEFVRRPKVGEVFS